MESVVDVLDPGEGGVRQPGDYLPEQPFPNALGCRPTIGLPG